MVTSSLGTPSPPMPSLSLPWSWRVDFQYLLASSLLKSPAPSSPQGKVTGFPCHHFGWEDRHGCLCLPSGPPPPLQHLDQLSPSPRSSCSSKAGMCGLGLAWLSPLGPSQPSRLGGEVTDCSGELWM